MDDSNRSRWLPLRRPSRWQGGGRQRHRRPRRPHGDEAGEVRVGDGHVQDDGGGTRRHATLAGDLEWSEIDGAGTVYTFTVARRPTGPPWTDAVPQLLAVVQWDAGPRISTELVDVDPGEVRIGMRVAPVFCDVPGTSTTLLRYRPAT